MRVKKRIQQVTEGRTQLWLSIMTMHAEPPGQKVSYPAACQRLGHYPQQRCTLYMPLFPYVPAPRPRWKLGWVLEAGLDGADACDKPCSIQQHRCFWISQLS